MTTNNLVEAKLITKFKASGEKVRRVACRPGFKLNAEGTSCVPMSGSEKASKKLAIKKSLKTKASKGAGLKNRTNKKRVKALKHRKSRGF